MTINFEDIGITVKEGDTITFEFEKKSLTGKIKSIKPGRLPSIKNIEVIVNGTSINIICNSKNFESFHIELVPFVEPPADTLPVPSLSTAAEEPSAAEEPTAAEQPTATDQPSAAEEPTAAEQPSATEELSSDSEEESSPLENKSAVKAKITISDLKLEIKKVESPVVLSLIEKYNLALKQPTRTTLKGVNCLSYINDTCATFEKSFDTGAGYIDLNMGKVLLILTIRLESIGIEIFQEIGTMIENYVTHRKTPDSVGGYKNVLVLYFKQFALKQKNEKLVFKLITDIFNSIYNEKNIEKEKAIIKSIEIILDQEEKEKNERLKALKLKEIKKEDLTKSFLRLTRKNKPIKNDRTPVIVWVSEFLGGFLKIPNKMIHEISSGKIVSNATGTETFYEFEPILCFNDIAKKANILKTIRMEPHFSFWGNFNQEELVAKPKVLPPGFTDGRDLIGFGYHVPIILPSGIKCYFRLQSTARFISKDLYGQWGPDETSLVFDISNFPDELNSHVLLNRQKIDNDYYLESEMTASLDELKEKVSKINQADFAVLNVILDPQYQFIEKMATMFLLLRKEFILWMNAKSIYDPSNAQYQPKYYFTKFGGTKRRQRKTRNKKNRKTRKHLKRSR
jgi:hypothetical protein